VCEKAEVEGPATQMLKEEMAATAAHMRGIT